MPRASSGVARHRRVSKTLKSARGYFGGRSKLYRTAKESVMRAGAYAFAGRKNRKREYRGLWIIRITAAAKERGIPYNRLIDGLKKAKAGLDRKILAHLAVYEPKVFDSLVALAKGGA
ncbi:MAG: 50S ribosomal protein L20 [Planctomycetota bacterium]|nr:50S ribosomal protein L20 [Planctomycetota bacterium]